MARTRADDFEQKQNAILKSAATVIAERGMEKASMAQVASHGGVSKALLYHYYPSKDALIFDIIKTHLLELDHAVSEADDRAIPADARLRKLIWAVLDTYRDADNEHKVQLNASSALNDTQKAEIRAIERRIVTHFCDTLAEINPLLVNKDKPLIMPVAMSLFGILNWMYLWFRDDGKISREDYSEIVSTMMLEGIKAVG
ncbi:MAG: TetR/AcrR family transcriptional regulator [Beijerinckiaceae bacterium]|nr:TetR/AcrR family transcriptional regulator [Beijerinckiaceae bacterium]